MNLFLKTHTFSHLNFAFLEKFSLKFHWLLAPYCISKKGSLLRMLCAGIERLNLSIGMLLSVQVLLRIDKWPKAWLNSVWNETDSSERLKKTTRACFYFRTFSANTDFHFNCCGLKIFSVLQNISDCSIRSIVIVSRYNSTLLLDFISLTETI